MRDPNAYATGGSDASPREPEVTAMSDPASRSAADAEAAAVVERTRICRQFDERWLEALENRPEPPTASSIDGTLVVDGDGLDEWLVADHAVPAADAR